MGNMIAAVATGKQTSAIGVIRISGEGCIQAASAVFTPKNGRPLSAAPNRNLILGTLRDSGGRVIDEAMAVVFRAPASYTGEDAVELQCHGSPAVLAAGLAALFSEGIRQAKPGEFTKRAFLNGRMDLSQAEAVADLIEAESADAAANAAGQLGGAILRKITPIYDELVDVMAHFHAVLDYPDEEIEPFLLKSYRESFLRDAKTLNDLGVTFGRGRLLRHGIPAVILGKPNVGKSSLLNALAGYDRAIVTPSAGTTRDTVEEPVRIGRHVVRLIDTAGIRETDDPIERAGVERARTAVSRAELALFICDGANKLDEDDRRVIEHASIAPITIAVLNKSDLGSVVEDADLPFDRVVHVSAKTGAGLSELTAALTEAFDDETPCDGSILTNERQAEAVTRAERAIRGTIDAIDAGFLPDAVLMDVEAAISALGEITGRTMRAEITARIFERFCVGK